MLETRHLFVNIIGNIISNTMVKKLLHPLSIFLNLYTIIYLLVIMFNELCFILLNYYPKSYGISCNCKFTKTVNRAHY